jgi:hypothetical protein
MVSDIEVAHKMCQISTSAKSRNIPFDMTFKKVKQLLLTKKCYFTNAELNNIHNDDNQLTFDRVDNTKGYIDSNVVGCSKRFNTIKGNLTPTEIELLYKGVMKKMK